MDSFSHPEFASHERVLFIADEQTRLRAIIAIHSTQRGPAIGGCRMWPYQSQEAALSDALRLSRGMTYKNALAGIDSGGGKSVIIGNPVIDKTQALLKAMGKAVNDLGGLYIAAEDSGTSPNDMSIMAESTPFVAGLDHANGSGDPSPSTAHGVYLSICEAVHFRLGKAGVSGLRVHVQGLGKVGFALAEMLAASGAIVVGSDIKPENCRIAERELSIETTSNDSLFNQACDVFAPCAMGGVLNQQSIPNLRTSIVAGAANNQLLTQHDHVLLHEAGILYCPDYLINAGGVIEVYRRRHGDSADAIAKSIGEIAPRLRSILEEANQRAAPPEKIARERADTILRSDRQNRSEPWAA